MPPSLPAMGDARSPSAFAEEVLTSMNAESPYTLYLDLANGRSVTSDNPAFSVAFGRRSKVVYRDTSNEIVLGASFDGPTIDIDTDGLTRQILSTPALGGSDTYAAHPPTHPGSCSLA